MRKHLIPIILIIALIFAFSAGTFAAAPSVTASAAIVMDYETGEILYAKDIDTMRCPASMTKIMTAYIIYEEMAAGNITKDTLFTISNNARTISKNSNYPMAVPLVGETVSVGKLLDLIMVPSASASCIVAAENISGSEAKFVERMNQTAKEMGIQTAYKNSHGAIPHYVTCRSVAELIRNFISKYPDILTYTAKTGITYNGSYYKNTNNLLNPNSGLYYPEADGFKTGTIAAAGYCLSATAEKDGNRVITVVMNSSSTQTRHTDSQKLLDYGFSEVKARKASVKASQAEITVEHPLRIGADMNVSVTFRNVTTPFISTFTLAIAGTEYGTITQKVQNGTTLNFTVNLDETHLGKESIEATIHYSYGTYSTTSAFSLPVSNDPPATFKDTAYHWAEKDIDDLCLAQVVNGYDDRTFRPDNDITRAEFVTILCKTFTFEDSGEPIAFTDTAYHWAKDDIALLSSLGIIEGYNQQFRPDDAISRQEAATILNRILVFEEQADLPQFADTAMIASWAQSAVANLTESGLINGYPDGTFQPTKNMTRAETAVFIKRILLFSIAEA